MTYVAKLALSEDEMSLVKRAKEETKQSLTKFVSYASVARARKVLKEAEWSEKDEG